MFGNLEGAVRRGRGGKEKEWTDCVQSAIRASAYYVRIQSIQSIKTSKHNSICCCFSHSAHWLPTRKKLLYTVANPARGLLNREKKKKKKVWQRTPPPPFRGCSFGEKIKSNKIKN